MQDGITVNCYAPGVIETAMSPNSHSLLYTIAQAMDSLKIGGKLPLRSG